MCTEVHPTTAVPVFGEFNPSAKVLPRPGVYAVALDSQCNIGTISTPQGIFLPGGGSEPGELAAETLRREVREECGFALQIDRQIGRAIDYIYLEREATTIRLESIFFSAKFGHKMFDPVEADHTLAWLPAQEAATRLHRPSQTWIVHEAMKSNTRAGGI